MNPALKSLQSYPFEKLAALKKDVNAAAKTPIMMSIGEPKHASPEFVLNELHNHRNEYSQYPVSKGSVELRNAMANWVTKRFNLPNGSIDAEKNILPVSGTREALFSFAQSVINRHDRPVVVMPNPFYQIYEGAALLAEAEPFFINTTAKTHYLPDFTRVPESAWKRTQLVYICSPGNPTGAVMKSSEMHALMDLAERYDFIIASDECYSELYPDEKNPPTGLLAAAIEAGNKDFRRCVVFHSLSKRSNLAGLRSGFVAGDEKVMTNYLKYRTYHGCAMPLPVQAASIAAWNDEQHVIENRAKYREKFQAVIEILKPVIDIHMPEAGFYFWLKTPIDDQEFTKRLYEQQNVTVLPGSYLSRHANGMNPGQNHVRIALVAELNECIDAAQRIKEFLQTL